MNKLVFYLLLGFLWTQQALAGQKVRVCSDLAGFPPYSYEENGLATGVTVDLIREIARRNDRSVEIVFLPWLRCLQEVETGKNFSLVLDATYSDEHNRKYLISSPLYAVHSALYYEKQRFPTPPVIDSLDDMKKYRYCGIHGYNYSMYSLPENRIDRHAKTEQMRFRMLRSGRCDFAIAEIEPLQGFVNSRQLDLSGLERIPVPEFKSKDYFVLVSREAAEGVDLVEMIDRGLIELKADGTYRAIQKRYGLAR